MLGLMAPRTQRGHGPLSTQVLRMSTLPPASGMSSIELLPADLRIRLGLPELPCLALATSPKDSQQPPCAFGQQHMLQMGLS